MIKINDAFTLFYFFKAGIVVGVVTLVLQSNMTLKFLLFVTFPGSLVTSLIIIPSLRHLNQTYLRTLPTWQNKITTGKKIWPMNCMRADKNAQINLNKNHIQCKVYTDIVQDILRLCKWLKWYGSKTIYSIPNTCYSNEPLAKNVSLEENVKLSTICIKMLYWKKMLSWQPFTLKCHVSNHGSNHSFSILVIVLHFMEW